MAEAILAEVILSPLVEAAVGPLAAMIQNEVSLVWGVKQELEKLSSTLSAVKSVLKDAEEKQVKDNSVRDWLQKLKEVAYQVDDILDDYVTEASRWQSAEHTTDGCNMQVSNFLPCICFKKVFFRRSIGHKIREINDRLSKIAEDRVRYTLTVGISEKKIENRETHSFVDEKTVLGRESEKKKIVDLLLSSDNTDGDVFVIPIVGLGGLGKTTLAQFVYNDEKIEKHFQPRMWVCVSEDFDIKRLIKAIIESEEKNCQLGSLDQLQDHLREMLRGKRFLLVLDDVWNEDQSKWESLMNLLRGGEKGSRIIVTTRSEKVSPIMVRTTTVHVECLSDDDCWRLFAQRAYSVRIEEVHSNMIAIGKEIVRKCKGVPLAAKSLGSLMHLKREESEWEEIRDNETWDLLNDERGILNALRISYDNLPTYLKQCFAYCCVYPKDNEIKKEELIRLWMAQGFIQPSTGNSRQLEDIGSDYFNDLVWRSFFQDEERDDDGNIYSCKMHDLMHDLAQSIAKDECRSCIQLGKAEDVIAHHKPYHLSLVIDGNLQEQPTIPRGLYKSSYLRTLLIFNPFYSHDFDEVRVELFLKLRCLRVLDLSWCGISKLPDSIGNLKHLRYLNLRGNFLIQSLPETICNLWNLQMLDLSQCSISKLPDSIGNLKHLRYLNLCYNLSIQSLPETICNLWNLQTLDITDCGGLTKLPKCIKNMVSLRHLETFRSSIKYMPSGIGRLTCLQKLDVYRVGKAESEFGGLAELQHLKNLRGALTIEELENAKNIEEAKKANLRGKQHLHTLELEWTYWREQVDAQEEEEVLEALQPHTNLRHLRIVWYSGAKFPSWMQNSSLTNLVSISLNGSPISCECLPSFGKLQLLKELEIKKVHGVKYFSTIDGSNYDEENTLGFPSLEKLYIDEMPDLEDWSTGGEGNLSCLRELVIENCPKLRALPKLPLLEKLQLYKMPDLEDWSTSGEGNLSFLLELDIRNCSKLRALPGFPSLERLYINDMPDLEDWSTSGQGNLSSLLELGIRYCPKLRALPGLPSLEKLELDKMLELEDLSIGGDGNLSCLRELVIENCPKLRALPELPSLEKLELYDTPNLEDWSAIGEGNLSRLCELNIRNYSNLRALPKLQSLKKLTLDDMPNLEDLSIGVEGNLSFLLELNINKCQKLRALPELPSLEKLEIYETPNLEDWLAIGEGNLSRLCELNFTICSNLRKALPTLKKLTLISRDDEIPLTLEHLPSLESLSIKYCVNITSLPDSIKNLSTLKNLNIYECPKLGSLPKGLKHLHALEELFINECPLLIERCKEGGEDWPNIAHVARIYIY